MQEQTIKVVKEPIQPEVVSETSPNKSNPKIVLFVVLGIAVVSSLVYIYYKNIKLNSLPLDKSCSSDSDCVLVVRKNDCSCCPEAVNQKELSSGKQLIKYSPSTAKSYCKKCKNIVYVPCLLTDRVFCQNSKCTTFIASQPTSTPDETANWKTYKNEVLGYTLKYPSDWRLNESKSDGYPYVGLIDPIAQKMAPSQTEIDRGAVIQIYTAPWLGKDESLLSLQKSLSSVEETAPSQEQETPVKVKESTKGQITGMWKSLRTEKVSGETFAFFREYEGKTLVFRVTITVFNSKDQTQPLTDSYLTIFDQILSTFKFLDQKTDETANWKTYANEKYSISFKYPSSWFVKDVTNEAPGNFLQSIAIFANGTTNPSVGAEGSEGNELLNLIITNPLINTEPMSQSKEQFINSWGKIEREKIVYVDNLPVAYNTDSKSVVIWYNEKIQIFVNPYQDTKNIMDQILSTFKFLD